MTINERTVAVWWRAANNKNRGLKAKDDELIGLRVIQGGFALGGPNLYGDPRLDSYDELPSAAAGYYEWYVGEVHIIAPELRPNLKRQAFEEGELTRQFVGRLRKWYQELEKSTRVMAARRNYLTDFEKERTYLSQLAVHTFEPTSKDKEDLAKIQNRLKVNFEKLNRNRGKQRNAVTYDVAALRESAVKSALNSLKTEADKLAKAWLKSDSVDDEQLFLEPVVPSKEETAHSLDGAWHQPNLNHLPETNTPSSEYLEETVVSDPSIMNLGAAELANVENLQYFNDVITGILAQVLSEEIPGEVDLRTRIVEKFQYKVRSVLSNV